MWHTIVKLVANSRNGAFEFVVDLTVQDHQK